MKVDAIIHGEIEVLGEAAQRAERLGFDGVVSPEVAHDPFVPLVLAAAVTERVRLQTGIAVAFARNPMIVAVIASDLQRLSRGRFTLGLGSQIRAHVTRRFSMPWSQPADRMREFVLAVRAIWHAWESDEPLAFKGEFYEHTLMTPMFSHGTPNYQWPPVFVAGVGPAMTAIAGEVAEGYLAHGFTTPGYLRSVTLPQLEIGLQRSGRSRGDIEVSIPVLFHAARSDQDHRRGRDGLRQTIAFYGSTPAYRPVLEHHGWGDLGLELHSLSRQGAWEKMADAVPDELVDLMSVSGSITESGVEIARRFAGIADRVQIGLPAGDDDARALLEAIRVASHSS